MLLFNTLLGIFLLHFIEESTSLRLKEKFLAVAFIQYALKEVN